MPRTGDFCQTCGLDLRSVTPPAIPPQQQVPPQQPLYGTPPPPQQQQAYQQPYQAPYQTPVPQQPYQAPYQPPVPQQPQPYQQPYQASYQQPAYQPAPPSPVASNCPRCSAAVPAGYTQCPNCGLDLRGAWGAQAPAHRSYAMPAAIAAVGLCLIVAAATVFVVAQGGSRPAATPTAIAAAATQTDSALPSLVASPSANASAAAAHGTSEPSPSGVWTTFNSPDGKWSTSIPGKTAPLKSVSTSGTGDTAITQTSFLVTDALGAVYMVDTADLSDVIVSTLSTDEILQIMEGAFVTSETALVSSTSTTEFGYTARDLVLTSGNTTTNIRMWLVGNRFYMLMASGAGTIQVYPEYFFKAFVLK
jgi:hypothetical protein